MDSDGGVAETSDMIDRMRKDKSAPIRISVSLLGLAPLLHPFGALPGDWSFVDGFYFSMVTLTTVGQLAVPKSCFSCANGKGRPTENNRDLPRLASVYHILTF